MVNTNFKSYSPFAGYAKNSIFAQNAAKAKEAEKTEKSDKTEKAGGLSKKAEEYLEKLKKKYGNIDFIIKDFSGDEEANKYLSSGKGDYSCIITPDLLEQMANDDDVASKYEGLIDEGISQLDELKTNVGNFEFAGMVEKYGFNIGTDGQINYYALLKEGLPKNAPKETETDKKPDDGYFKLHNTGKVPLLKGSTTDELFEVIEQASRGMFGSNVEFLTNNRKDIYNPDYNFKA